MRLYSFSSLGFPVLAFFIASLNALLTLFVLISLFGSFLIVNSRLSPVRFSLRARVPKYRLRYLTASSPMKFGLSCSTLILHGIGVLGSKISSTSPILSCFILWGGNPDCRMIVKNAFSRGRDFSVILLISSFVISLYFMFSTLPDLVTFLIIKGYYVLYKGF